jgi:uncharacterized protein YhfF
MWPRLDGLRALELGTPGEMRMRLNDLVLAGFKTATAGTLAEYEREGEALERVGEHLALLDDSGNSVATVEVTAAEVLRFADVDWAFAQAEGEGFMSLEHWRQMHAEFFSAAGVPVDDDSSIACISFRLVLGPGSRPQTVQEQI